MIKIVDNFFKDNDLKMIQDFALTKAFYTPRFFVNAPERTEQYNYGSRWQFNNEPELLDIFVKQAELKFKIKIKELNNDSGIDQRTLTCFKPHTDDNSILNILIMLSGPTAVTNGTVFYTEGDLDIHVGFKENRAILFPSNKFHSPHANEKSNITRYSATLFIKDYE
tara:strand:+ start:42 stop:542 length:501 start_codon:yes stop_codon:yes gene_type:complete